jgi:hypothetical protein
MDLQDYLNVGNITCWHFSTSANRIGYFGVMLFVLHYIFYYILDPSTTMFLCLISNFRHFLNVQCGGATVRRAWSIA